MKSRFYLPVIFCLSLTCLAAGNSAASEAADFSPSFTPSVITSRTTGPIELDGVLDEATWQTAGKAANFSERSPGDNVKPQVKTEAYITYDDDNLYVAFVCHDDPELLRTTMCQRDQFFNDDAVGLMIDTFGEAQWAYEFFVNPYGVQKDIMWTNIQGEDRGFDMVWHSAAKINEDGYVVEMALPFAAMRFPNQDIQQWRIDFWRVHPRDSFFQYSWAADDRNEQCFPCKWGTVEGIEGVRPGKGLEILPSVIAYQTGHISDELDADSEFQDNDIKAEGSLSAKYSVSSDITLEGAYNPDFSQIEADADQIDVNTTIVQRFPEKRPFFQEGNDLFRTMFNSFYTRMVNDPEVAAKGTARWEKTSLAYVMARDEHSPYIIPTEERSYSLGMDYSTVNVLRGLQSLGSGSQVGFMATDRRYDKGGSGTILSGDANIRLSSTFRWMAQWVYSHTEEPEGISVSPGETFANGKHTVDLDGETYSGNALITELRRNARHWNLTLDYNQVNPTYRTQTGYDPWNDQKNGFIYTDYRIYPEGEGLLERITPSVFVNGRWNTSNVRKWFHYQGSLNFQLRWAQTNVGLRYASGTELWGGVEFKDLWRANINLNSQPWDQFGYFLGYRFGKNPALRTLDKGDEQNITLALNIKPFDRLIIEPTINHIRSDHAGTGKLLFKQTIARMRVRLQLSNRLSVRLVVQNNQSKNPYYLDQAQGGDFGNYHMYFGSKWEVDPLVTYRINSFSVFYAGSTHDYRDFNAGIEDGNDQYILTDRQYFMKLQYLFQI